MKRYSICRRGERNRKPDSYKFLSRLPFDFVPPEFCQFPAPRVAHPNRNSRGVLSAAKFCLRRAMPTVMDYYSSSTFAGVSKAPFDFKNLTTAG
jgi:hypothetical protein